MAQQYFEIDGVQIKAPDTYKPTFATTSTEDSDRTQDLIMHNTPMGTVIGYDVSWGELTPAEIAVILNGMINKSSFLFKHRDPTVAAGWSTAAFYASNFSMAAQTLKDGEEMWTDLAINVRGINPK